MPESERNEILPEDIDGLEELDDDDIEALIEWFPHLSLQPHEPPLSSSPIESSLSIDDQSTYDASPMRHSTPTASPPLPPTPQAASPPTPITPSPPTPPLPPSPPSQPTVSTTTSPTSPISPALLPVQPRPLVRIVPARLKASNKENIPENIVAQILSTPIVANCAPATPPVQQPTPPPPPPPQSPATLSPAQPSPRRKAKAGPPKSAAASAPAPARRVLGDITKAINNQAASRKRRVSPPVEKPAATAQPRKRSPNKTNTPKPKETVESTPRKRSPRTREPVESPEKVSPTKRRVTFSEHNITHAIPSRFDDDDSAASTTWAAVTPARPVKVVQVPSSISPDDVKRTLRKRTLAEKESMWRVEMASMQQALREIDEETLLVELVRE